VSKTILKVSIAIQTNYVFFLILKENEKEKRTNQIAKRGILFQNELLATLPKLTHH